MKKEDIIYAKMHGDSGLVNVNHKQEAAIEILQEKILDLMAEYAKDYPIDFTLEVSGNSKNNPTMHYVKHIPPEWQEKFNRL